MSATALKPGRRGRGRTAPLAATAVFAVCVTGLALVVGIKGTQLAGATALAVAGFAVLSVALVFTERHGLTLAVFLLYVGLLDGFLKLKSGTELPTLGRDVLLYAIAIGMVIRATLRKEPIDVPPLTGWVVAFVAVVLVQLLNPANQSLSHSLVSLRQHIEFVPLFFIGYVVMRDTQRLRGFFVLLLGVATVNGVVSLVQFNLTPEQLAAWGPGYEQLLIDSDTDSARVADVDGESRTRPMALGSDSGFGGVLGFTALPAALALIATGDRSRRLALLALPLLGGCILAIATSQSRAAVIGGFLAVFAFAALAIAARQTARLIGTLVVVVVLAVGAAAGLGGAPDSKSFRYESISPDRLLDTTYESRVGTYALLPIYARDFPLGAGIGSAGPAAGFGDSTPKRNLSAESQFNFLLIELGIVGLLVLIGFNAHLIARVVGGLRRLRDTEHQLLLAGLAAPLLVYLASWTFGINTTSAPNAPYFWFAAGTLVWWLRSPGPEQVGGPQGTAAQGV